MMSTVSEKLLQVAQNNPKVYHSGQLNIVKNAECLKNNKSGSAILIDDISPVTHEMGVKVRGKNLFDISKITNTASLTNNGDGTITIAANIYASPTEKSLKGLCPDLKIGDIITLSAITESDAKLIYLQTSQKEIRFGKYTTITQNDLDSRVVFYGHKRASEKYGTPCIISNIQIEYGEKATAYTPYVPDLTAVKVTRRGKNLFSGLTKGVGINSNDGSEITNSNYAVSDYIPVDFNTNTNYYISGLPTTISNYIAAYNANKEFLGRTGGNAFAERRLTKTQFPNGTPQGTGDIAYLRVSCFKISTSAGTVDDIDDCNIQLEIGSTATDYEPYNSATFTPTADGTVNGVTSLYPNTTLTTDTDGVIFDCEYYKDVDKAFNELTTSVALSGGDS